MRFFCDYGIKIKEGKPFILDFSNKPKVIFPSPAKDARYKPGDQIEVKAVLIDPELDIMMRGIDDTSQKVTIENTRPDGTKSSYERDLSLDPTVVIKRKDGTVLNEGKMPFG